MNVKQRTVRNEISISGVGLHTGKPATLTFKPAPENHGYKFKRVDLENSPIIEADVDNVTDTSRGTTISQNGASVSTIEHLLAAFVGMEIDNVLIEIDGPEVPILDGSALEYTQAIEKAGIQTQTQDREYYVIQDNIHYTEADRKVEMVAMPLDGYRFTCMIDYNSPVLGSQHASISSIDEFKKEIASSRTFCFLHELETLVANNLIKGGDLNNAIVVVDKEVGKEELSSLAKLFNREDIAVAREGILNNIELRHQNEPARHKLLDMIGDLALVGQPIKGHIMAARPGHAANVAFAKKIKQQIKKAKESKYTKVFDPNMTPVYDTIQIMEILPHRQPCLWIDESLDLSKNDAVGLQNRHRNGHLHRQRCPGQRIFRRVLSIEGMAQTGGIVVLNTVPVR